MSKLTNEDRVFLDTFIDVLGKKQMTEGEFIEELKRVANSPYICVSFSSPESYVEKFYGWGNNFSKIIEFIERNGNFSLDYKYMVQMRDLTMLAWVAFKVCAKRVLGFIENGEDFDEIKEATFWGDKE